MTRMTHRTCMLAACKCDSSVIDRQEASTVNNAPVHLTPRQLAERWHGTVPHLANLRSAGDGPEYLKIGARVLYPLAVIEDYEAGSLVKTSARP